MRKWTLTTIVWPMCEYRTEGATASAIGVPTTIPAGADGKSAEHLAWHCVSIVAESTRFPRYRLRVQLRRATKVPLGSFEEEFPLNPAYHPVKRISNRLAEFAKNGNGEFHWEPHGYCIDFPLQQGVPFSEQAVTTVQDCMRHLGIQDPGQKLLANFMIPTKTIVLESGRYESYEDWLRRKFDLEQPLVYHLS